MLIQPTMFIKNWGLVCLKEYMKSVSVMNLTKEGLQYERQIDVPIVYDGISFDEGFRLDVLVEDLIICELKAIDKWNPVYKAQVISHLNLTGKRLGFLINFNERLIRDGIQRIII